MNVIKTTPRIHPLVAVAAVSVTLVSLLGIAAITGVLPTSHGLTSESARSAGQSNTASKETDPVQSSSQEALPAKQASRADSTKATTHTAQQTGSPAPVQTAQKPAERNSAVGIGVGALIGGAIGSQVGSGDGKTLATIAGAVGGGYIGNEVAKKNQK